MVNGALKFRESEWKAKKIDLQEMKISHFIFIYGAFITGEILLKEFTRYTI